MLFEKLAFYRTFLIKEWRGSELCMVNRNKEIGTGGILELVVLLLLGFIYCFPFFIKSNSDFCNLR